MPTIQFRHDLWYVDGGMYNLAVGLRRLVDELGIDVRCGAEVTRIERQGARVTGVTLADGTTHAADVVVSNMEVIPACRELLGEDPALVKEMEKRLEPACSALVVELGLDRQYPQLAHHNFFFSDDQRRHFDDVFRKRRLPGDPTVYLVAASRTDPTVAPPGCDALKILPHIPYLHPDRETPHSEYMAFKERVLDKLERMGLKNLRKHVVVDHTWTPVDIEREYRSNRGSIYGVVSDRFRNLAFKAPKQSTKYPNLFFVGGSVNPGGGMPMVALCGQKVAERIVKWDAGRHEANVH
jgi:diapolycopene oxygenase